MTRRFMKWNAASISLLLAENRDIIAGQESQESTEREKERERQAKFERFIARPKKEQDASDDDGERSEWTRH